MGAIRITLASRGAREGTGRFNTIRIEISNLLNTTRINMNWCARNRKIVLAAASEAVELGRLRGRCDFHLRKPYGCGLFLADFSRFDSSRETFEACRRTFRLAISRRDEGISMATKLSARNQI